MKTGFDSPCPIRSTGLHEIYTRGTVRHHRGIVCRACGARDVSEYDLMEAVIACAKTLVGAKKEPSTAHSQISALELGLQGAVDALVEFRASHPEPLSELSVLMSPPIGKGSGDP